YRWTAGTDDPGLPQAGQLVLVPFGRREVAGLVVGIAESSAMPEEKIRDVIGIRTQLPSLTDEWLAMCRFAADYYQRALGEVALPALPKNLRALSGGPLDRALKKISKLGSQAATTVDRMNLLPAQQEAVDAITGAQQ